MAGGGAAEGAEGGSMTDDPMLIKAERIEQELLDG